MNEVEDPMPSEDSAGWISLLGWCCGLLQNAAHHQSQSDSPGFQAFWLLPHLSTKFRQCTPPRTLKVPLVDLPDPLAQVSVVFIIDP